MQTDVGDRVRVKLSWMEVDKKEMIVTGLVVAEHDSLLQVDLDEPIDIKIVDDPVICVYIRPSDVIEILTDPREPYVSPAIHELFGFVAMKNILGEWMTDIKQTNKDDVVQVSFSIGGVKVKVLITLADWDAQRSHMIGDRSERWSQLDFQKLKIKSGV